MSGCIIFRLYTYTNIQQNIFEVGVVLNPHKDLKCLTYLFKYTYYIIFKCRVRPILEFVILFYNIFNKIVRILQVMKYNHPYSLSVIM